ncbi:UNVERIFIED_CONTAM: hypothetical protein K2H54_002542, partial [Gekko kuhli]
MSTPAAEQRLEAAVQTLEGALLVSAGGKGLSLRGACEDSPPTRLPARIREIITKNLTEAFPAEEMSALLSPEEENRLLQQELSRVEDLLAQSRAERDELAIKYNAISERADPLLLSHGSVLPKDK